MSGLSGLLILDKPYGWTSHQAVHLVRRVTRQKKVGHGGTLDPMATGVLPIMVGRATRLMEHISTGSKEYLATVKLGEITDTLDTEGAVIERRAIDPSLDEGRAAESLSRFRGTVRQKVPLYSALRKNGKRLYEIARSGEDVDQPERTIHIDQIQLVDLSPPFIVFSVTCGKGTYVRQLAADVGEALGCGGHLIDLRRLRVGHFHHDEAVSVAALKKTPPEKLPKLLRPLRDAVSHLQEVEIETRQALTLAHGQSIAVDVGDSTEVVAATLKQRDLVALGPVVTGRLVPRRVFCSPADFPAASPRRDSTYPQTDV
jgi:tRNA pseudouridine55 synthase